MASGPAADRGPQDLASGAGHPAAPWRDDGGRVRPARRPGAAASRQPHLRGRQPRLSPLRWNRRAASTRTRTWTCRSWARLPSSPLAPRSACLSACLPGRSQPTTSTPDRRRRLLEARPPSSSAPNGLAGAACRPKPVPGSGVGRHDDAHRLCSACGPQPDRGLPSLAREGEPLPAAPLPARGAAGRSTPALTCDANLRICKSGRRGAPSWTTASTWR